MFTETIEKIYSEFELTDKTKLLVNEFINSDKKYVFGRNEYSEHICKRLKVDYVIDDYAERDSWFHGAVVIKTDEVPKNSIVVNCVVMAYCLVAQERIISCGIKSVINYSDLCYSFPERFEFPRFIIDTRHDFFKNKDKWQGVFSMCSDNTSRQILNDILLYRLTGQYKFLNNYAIRIKEQYFEDFLYLKADEIFVDCGGFEGETTEEFIVRCPDYKKIYFFEPSEENLKEAKRRLAGNSGIEFISKGVSDKKETLYFNFSGSASCICDGGSITISTLTIDKAVKENPTFIKMDLEGWELKALKGAKEHIKMCTPRLAIAVYHKPEDFHEILDYVISLNPNYNVYIRHYTQGWVETIMFFIPK